jgi:hypothetical protein
MDRKQAVPAVVVVLLAFGAGFLGGRFTSPEMVVVRTPPPSAPAQPIIRIVQEPRPPERTSNPANPPGSVASRLSSDAPKTDSKIALEIASTGKSSVKPGLLPVEFTLANGKLVTGFHDCLPTTDQVREIVSSGRDKYIDGQVEKRQKTLKAIIGDDEWNSRGLEGPLKDFLQDWASKKWDADKEWADAAALLASTAMSPEERKKGEQRIRKDWGDQFATAIFEQSKGFSERIPWAVYQKHEDEIGKVERYSE